MRNNAGLRWLERLLDALPAVFKALHMDCFEGLISGFGLFQVYKSWFDDNYFEQQQAVLDI